MARGGRREGAGRRAGTKDGSSTSRAARLELTRQIAEKAATEGIMPLEVMLSAMRDAWENADKDKAVQIAEKAAPYMHARLAAVQVSGDAQNPLTYAIVSGVPREDEAKPELGIDERTAPTTH